MRNQYVSRVFDMNIFLIFVPSDPEYQNGIARNQEDKDLKV